MSRPSKVLLLLPQRLGDQGFGLLLLQVGLAVFGSGHQIAVILDDMLRRDSPLQHRRDEVVRVTQIRETHHVVHGFPIAELE